MATKRQTSKTKQGSKATAKARTASKPVKKAAKKTVAKKAVAKKAPVKKAVVKKKAPAQKAVAKKAPAKKAVKKAPVKKAAPPRRAAKAVEVEEEIVIKQRKWTPTELDKFRALLKNLRDRVVDEISFLAGDNLNRSQRDSSGDLSSYSFHMADQGTDNFDREFALNLVSSEQDALYEIDEALQRIDSGEYGMCEACGCAIEKPRLKALPFCRMCVRCKAESERGKTRYRPFSAPMSTTSSSQD